MDSEGKHQRKNPFNIHFVSSLKEFSVLHRSLSYSSVVGLDAEWKPSRKPNPDSFPPVSLLQIACRGPSLPDVKYDEAIVFLLDLQSLPLPAIWELLRDMFVSPDILKLGFRFKQDLAYLSSTFCSQGCELVFDKVEPYLDIASIYHHLQYKRAARKLPRETKSLAAICAELLGIDLAKEFQCSDWSCRPLTEDQRSYAAADAYYLLEIFSIFEFRFLAEGPSIKNISEPVSSNGDIGLRAILEKFETHHNNIVKVKFCEASTMIHSVDCIVQPSNHPGMASTLCLKRIAAQMDDCLIELVQKYGERILLKDSDRKPGVSKKKGKKHSPMSTKEVSSEDETNRHGPPPWDLSLGGNGCPRFLCDVMVEGLAKHLRCVGIDAAVPSSRKPEPRDLLNQADKEKRVLLTRDGKLLKYQYLTRNQVYRVKSLLKNDQLLEIIDTFHLKICEDQLMSRCTKCNGRFIQKPLTIEEAIVAAKRFQVIPQCLLNQDIEFWQCSDCYQIYWEGTQYQNAVQKFIDVCKLNEQS